MELSTHPVCPDDLGKLSATAHGLQCLQCGRYFPVADGILELLPREAYQETSAETQQFNRYRAIFSRRPDRKWYQPLREIQSAIGSGYLYSWGVKTTERFADGRSLSILDAACGDGILRHYLSNRHSYVGIDFSSRLLVRANRHNPAAYFRADLNSLPFPSGTFDAVLSFQALQYLDRPEVALAQMARILKPGGRLLLTVPNDESFKYRFQGIPSIQLQRFGRGNLQNLVTRNFDVLHLGSRGFWIPVPKIPIHLPGAYATPWGLSWTILATPRK